jgi:hydrogenase maturation protease
MSTSPPRVRLLVCGSVDRADDGAAIWAVANLPSSASAEQSGIDVHRCGHLDIEDLMGTPSGSSMLIVDAAVGIHPGQVITLSFDELVRRTSSAAPRSSHSLPIDQVIGVARQLSEAPIDGLFVGIGAADVTHGGPLSSPVREGMAAFLVAIEQALQRLQATAQPLVVVDVS